MNYHRIIPCLSFLFMFLVFTVPLEAAQNPKVWWEDAVKKAEEEGYQLIESSQLHSLYQDKEQMTVIDNRYEYEFKYANILPGAVNVPFRPAESRSLDPGKKEQLISAMGDDKDRTIIFYCRSFR